MNMVRQNRPADKSYPFPLIIQESPFQLDSISGFTQQAGSKTSVQPGIDLHRKRIPKGIPLTGITNGKKLLMFVLQFPQFTQRQRIPKPKGYKLHHPALLPMWQRVTRHLNLPLRIKKFPVWTVIINH